MLVLSLHLQDVEEIGCGGVDLDQIFIRLWRGVWETDDLEVVEFLDELVGGDSSQNARVTLTLTYWATCIPFIV